MSTRCQIGFYEPDAKSLDDFEVLIYRHSNGYPDTEQGVLADIVPTLEQFDKNRGLDDIECSAAWLVTKLTVAQIDKYLDSQCPRLSFLEIGICKDFHPDIEFYYAIYPDRIDVYSVNLPYANSNVTPKIRFSKIKSVPIYREIEVCKILKKSLQGE